jgi:hypothetical protein
MYVPRLLLSCSRKGSSSSLNLNCKRMACVVVVSYPILIDSLHMDILSYTGTKLQSNRSSIIMSSFTRSFTASLLSFSFLFTFESLLPFLKYNTIT